jgi:protease YdgD
LPHHFGQADDRVKVTDATHAPWAAIGRLDIGYELPCTAVQTDSRILTTAGHCASGKKISVPGLNGEIIIPDRTITYSAGHTEESKGEEARVIAFFRPASFHDSKVRHDYAFAVLDKAVGEKGNYAQFLDPAVMTTEDLMNQNTPLVQAGYSADAPHTMSAHIGARLLAFEKDGFYYDGDTLPGDSGSPVMVALGGTFYIAGISHGIDSLPDDYNATASFAAPAALMKDQYEAFRDFVKQGRLERYLPTRHTPRLTQTARIPAP